jgi:hypothetical protein
MSVLTWVLVSTWSTWCQASPFFLVEQNVLANVIRDEGPQALLREE